MGLDLSLQTKMSQSLVMSPRMQQAIKILQYNHLEMVGAIQEAVLENPTLEANLESLESGSELDRLRREAVNTQNDTTEQQNGAESGVDWEKFLEQMADRKPMASTGGGTIHDDLPPIETNLTYSESLAEHLLWQLHLLFLRDEERAAAEAIIHNLDHRGYLVASLEEIVSTSETTIEDVEDALCVVQSLDPLGCGARDLSECLIIQAKVHFPEDDNFERILTGHLGNLERRNYSSIAKELELELEDVVEYHKMIQELEPHPGRAYGGDEPRYITPDVYVEKRGDEWIIQLNEEGVPSLRISSYYQKVLKNASKDDKQYLLDKLRGAEFLIKSIDKRRKTIRAVMRSILNHQRKFFEEGVGNLRPLVLQEIADDVGVHMSTVSRVTTNKYVHTPHGIFELKYFFNAGVRQQSGEDMAAEALKEKVRQLIQAEDPKKPLSDQAIADALQTDGMRIARRTVAKYREALGILSSSKRKKMF